MISNILTSNLLASQKVILIALLDVGTAMTRREIMAAVGMDSASHRRTFQRQMSLLLAKRKVKMTIDSNHHANRYTLDEVG